MISLLFNICKVDKVMKNSLKENTCILFLFILTRKQIKYCSDI